MKIIQPNFLRSGDTIGITAPSGFIQEKEVQDCIQQIKDWGFKVKVGNTLNGKSKNYFSASDEERKKDLQQFLDDGDIKAILAARGGYGLSRIIDDLDFTYFTRNPKWIIGFSDITVLLSHIFSQYKIMSLHAPMARAFDNHENYSKDSIDSLYQNLVGQKTNYTFSPNPYNKIGTLHGRMVGGNLAILAHLVGSSSAINFNNKILFIEDIGEYWYNIDRMFLQLKRAGLLKNLKGLVVGKFSQMKDTTRPFGYNFEEVILSHTQAYDYPICFNFPVGHCRENYALKIGGRYALSIEKENCRLNQL